MCLICKYISRTPWPLQSWISLLDIWRDTLLMRGFSDTSYVIQGFYCPSLMCLFPWQVLFQSGVPLMFLTVLLSFWLGIPLISPLFQLCPQGVLNNTLYYLKLAPFTAVIIFEQLSFLKLFANILIFGSQLCYLAQYFSGENALSFVFQQINLFQLE